MSKKYNLLVAIYATHHGAGTALVSHIFGEYDTLELCQEAGKEVKANYSNPNSTATCIYYTCVPVYVKETDVQSI